MREFAIRWLHVLERLAFVPLSFMGVGLYRAWLAIFFRYGAYPGMDVSDYALFEVSIGVVCLVAAFTHRRVSPLWSNSRMLVAAALVQMIGVAAGKNPKRK